MIVSNFRKIEKIKPLAKSDTTRSMIPTLSQSSIYLPTLLTHSSSLIGRQPAELVSGDSDMNWSIDKHLKNILKLFDK
jgi:hypothetical protein